MPSGWWHATLNLPDSHEDVTVACTRNILPAETLGVVFPQMQRSDPAFARRFREVLHEKRPEFMRSGKVHLNSQKPTIFIHFHQFLSIFIHFPMCFSFKHRGVM